MKKSKFTDQQIAFALKQAESGTLVEEVCRKLGISQHEVARVLGTTRVLKLKGTHGAHDATEDQAFSVARASHLHR